MEGETERERSGRGRERCLETETEKIVQNTLFRWTDRTEIQQE